MLKKFFKAIQDHFHLTRKELIGFNVLSSILIAVILWPFLYDKIVAGKTLVHDSDYVLLDSLVREMEAENELKVFDFDPNIISEDSMNLLGLPDYVVKNWMAYRSSGGQFLVKSHFQKIYGLSEDDYYELEPYLLLPDTIIIDSQPKKEVRIKLEKFDINKATSEDLQKINGIGAILSTRIVKYRDLLGGFVKPEQYVEVYHLSETAHENLSKYTYIQTDFIPKKISINTAEYPMILRHPYITKELTDKIFNIRKSDSLLNALILKDLIDNDSVYYDLLPYIEF